jgi:hypothetical protein
VPPLEIDGAREVACLFLGERMHFVLELLNRDVRINGGLLLRLDHLVEVAELRVESGLRRPLFLQAAPRLAVLRLRM